MPGTLQHLPIRDGLRFEKSLEPGELSRAWGAIPMPRLGMVRRLKNAPGSRERASR